LIDLAESWVLVCAVRLQTLFIWVTIFAVPAQLLAQDADTALLYGDGVLVNSSVIPKSTTIFPGDVLTTKDGIANLVDTGSSAVINKNSIVDYQKKSLKLEHGQLQVATSAGMSVRVGCVVVSPAEEVLTKFEVLDVDGKIQIAARQGDVLISQGQRKERLPEGQQGTRNDSECKPGALTPSAVSHGILDSKTAILAGSAIAGGILIWLLIDQSGAPLSNSQP
jgi:hypothetical protein